MKRLATLTAIDVGTTKVCTTVAEVENGNVVRVVGVGLTPSTGMHKGLVVSVEDAKQSIRESVRKAEHVSGRKIDSAYIGVTGRHIASLNRRGAISIARHDRLVKLDDLKRVLQHARSLKVPTGQKLLHVIPRSYAVDGSGPVHNPVGLRGAKLHVETHVITAAAASMRNIARCIESLGIGIEELVLEPLASSEAVLTEQERQKGVVLADIGGGTTDVAIFRDGSIWHTAIIPVAGYQLTRDVAIGLGLPFNAAEDLKKTQGGVMPVAEEPPQPAWRRNDGARNASNPELNRVLRARVEEILRLITLELPQTDQEALIPGGLVLTGGSANLAGLDVMAREMLRMPVRIGSPVAVPGISESLQDPAYATNVGLLLWGARKQASPELKFSSLNENMRRLLAQFRSFSSVFRRLPVWNR
ncbi:MAG: cell division protein FtsA [Chloroflexi bacterium]|nr:cell division protein FtsA [Chloroflexota bacterium]